jgi:predicted transcriptional regulator
MGKELAELARAMEDIKRLLIVALMKNGVSQGDLAKALGVTQGTVSRLFKTGKTKKAK